MVARTERDLWGGGVALDRRMGVGGGRMMIEPFNARPRRMPEAERLDAAVKVAERLDGRPSGEIVSAFLSATLGDVVSCDGYFEARGYGFRATSIRNRAQAVRNWMIGVTARAATKQILEEQ